MRLINGKKMFSHLSFCVCCRMNAAAQAALSDHGGMAKPLHVQQMEQALQLTPLLSYVEDLLSAPQSNRYE